MLAYREFGLDTSRFGISVRLRRTQIPKQLTLQLVQSSGAVRYLAPSLSSLGVVFWPPQSGLFGGGAGRHFSTCSVTCLR